MSPRDYMAIEVTLDCPLCEERTVSFEAVFDPGETPRQHCPGTPRGWFIVEGTTKRTCSCDVDGEVLQRDAVEALQYAVLNETYREIMDEEPESNDDGWPTFDSDEELPF